MARRFSKVGGVGYQIDVIDLNSDDERKFYEDLLKGETKEAPCGEKSVIYTILSLAAETCNICKQMDKIEPYVKILKREMKGPRGAICP